MSDSFLIYFIDVSSYEVVSRFCLHTLGVFTYIFVCQSIARYVNQKILPDSIFERFFFYIYISHDSIIAAQMWDHWSHANPHYLNQLSNANRKKKKKNSMWCVTHNHDLNIAFISDWMNLFLYMAVFGWHNLELIFSAAIGRNNINRQKMTTIHDARAFRRILFIFHVNAICVVRSSLFHRIRHVHHTYDQWQGRNLKIPSTYSRFYCIGAYRNLNGFR